MTYIRPGLPPTFIVNGDSDHTVDPNSVGGVEAGAGRGRIPNGQDIVAGGGHGNFSAAESDKAMLLCLQFLKAHGVIP